jgi:tetratricopeptide (TPR) repeat protein
MVLSPRAAQRLERESPVSLAHARSARGARISALAQGFLISRWLMLVSVVAGSLLLVVAPRAEAREDAEPAGYRAAIDAAVAEFDASNFQEARALFSQAHALFPNARTLRGLGMLEFELRNYGASIGYLQRALSAQERPLEGELRTQTELLLARAQSFVATMHLDVRPGHGANVLVDGVPVTLGPSGVLLLEVGDHLVEVRTDGFMPEKRRLSLHGGEQQHLVIALRKPLDMSSTAHDSRPVYKNPWLWTGIGVVVSAVAVGTALALRPDGDSTTQPASGNTDVVLAGPVP